MSISADSQRGPRLFGLRDISRARLMDLFRNEIAVLRARWYLRSATCVGPRVRVWGHPSVRNYGGELIIGERTVLYSKIATLELLAAGGKLEVGARAFINYGSSIAATRMVHIGADCKIGMHCLIIDNDFHRLELGRRNERPESAPIILEDNVWLAARVIVLPGVTIGTGSVIGAGSVVTKDVPPRCLAAGIPAKAIRSL
jgi:acetyltransferase-like isoleucine patch superfamily enzyme